MTGAVIEALDEDAANDLAAKRQWVQACVEGDGRTLYEGSPQAKLSIIAAILEAGFLRPSSTVELQALGVALGDAISQETGWPFVLVEDEYGRDPGLHVDGSMTVFPVTMISKRVERGESVDRATLDAMFEQVCQADRIAQD